MDERLLGVYPELENRHFWWRVRRELVAALIADRRPIEGTSVLDVGCGSGVTMRFLRDLGATRTIGVEVAPEALGPESQKSDDIIIGDIMSLDIDEPFDVILMLDVLEHIENDEQAVKRVSEFMAPDGLLIVSVPAYMALWSQHDELNAHFRRYRLEQVTQLLVGADLTVLQAGYMFAGLVLPKLISRLLESFGQETSASAVKTANMSWLNNVAYQWFDTEARIGRGRPGILPFGTSIAAVATRSVS
jgi:SAM-dependent methyltransferase